MGLDESNKIFSGGFNNFLYFISFIWFQSKWEAKRKFKPNSNKIRGRKRFGLKDKFGLYTSSNPILVFNKISQRPQSSGHVAHYVHFHFEVGKLGLSQCINLWNKDFIEIRVNAIWKLHWTSPLPPTHPCHPNLLILWFQFIAFKISLIHKESKERTPNLNLRSWQLEKRCYLSLWPQESAENTTNFATIRFMCCKCRFCAFYLVVCSTNRALRTEKTVMSTKTIIFPI